MPHPMTETLWKRIDTFRAWAKTEGGNADDVALTAISGFMETTAAMLTDFENRLSGIEETTVRQDRMAGRINDLVNRMNDLEGVGLETVSPETLAQALTICVNKQLEGKGAQDG